MWNRQRAPMLWAEKGEYLEAPRTTPSLLSCDLKISGTTRNIANWRFNQHDNSTFHLSLRKCFYFLSVPGTSHISPSITLQKSKLIRWFKSVKCLPHKHGGISSGSWNPYKIPGLKAQSYHASTGESERGRSLELIFQSAWPNWWASGTARNCIVK